MPVRPVLAYPNSALRSKSLDVTDFNDELKAFAVDLCDTMDAATGAGLAACQIGAKARMFVINKRLANTDEHLVFVNPSIEITGQEKQTNLEGCLSFHGDFLSVTRPLSIVVAYQALDGEAKTLEASGYLAQAIQHEAEHLDVKLLIDHAPMVKKSLMKKRSRKLAGKMLDYRPESRG